MAVRLPPFYRRAQRRKRISQIRRRAPRHPVGPETAIRLAISKLLGAFHALIRQRVLAHAQRYREIYGRKLLDKGSDSPDPLMRSVFADLWDQGRYQLVHSAFMAGLRDNATKAADTTVKQVAAALNLDPFEVDLRSSIERLADGVYDAADYSLSAALDRASDVLDDWANLDPDYSERAGDLDSLDTMLEDGLSGTLGSVLATATLLYGMSWAEMNRGAQEAVGVSSYLWVAQNDSATRSEHRALDGEVAEWDDPPLKAEDSSNGEDDHAGEDYNCRCIASPIAPGEELDNG